MDYLYPDNLSTWDITAQMWESTILKKFGVQEVTDGPIVPNLDRLLSTSVTIWKTCLRRPFSLPPS
ncbi:hypothetical protein EYZ11_013142 [Aspergillus tanneri]|uniref:Uncharacterized protein n=1 Tax=Aspergillus tanneri TaxID=1220188 RepID=A0A4S3J3U9_9EURO|nr:hypothetical protein EYZ11_013142 [Aspergillus tanneri]